MNNEKITLQDYFYNDLLNKKMSLALETTKELVNILPYPKELHSMVQDILFDIPEGVDVLENDKVVCYYLSNDNSGKDFITLELYEDESCIGVVIEKAFNNEVFSFNYCQDINDKDYMFISNDNNFIPINEINTENKDLIDFYDLEEIIQIFCLVGDYFCEFELQ